MLRLFLISRFIPGLHVNYGETTLRIRDSLLKLKDFPRDSGVQGLNCWNSSKRILGDRQFLCRWGLDDLELENLTRLLGRVTTNLESRLGDAAAPPLHTLKGSMA